LNTNGSIGPALLRSFQVNVILQNEILPAFNKWLCENYYRILRMINDDAPRHTVN